MALTAKRVTRLISKGEPVMHLDERGLYLVVEGKTSAHWALRFQLDGRARLMGLGSARIFTLAQARERAQVQRMLLADGVDPLDARRTAKIAKKAAAATKLTFKEASEKFIAQRDAEWTSPKHAHEYLSSLKRYAWPYLGNMDVATIDVPHILQVLEQKVPAEKGFPAGTFWGARLVSADRTRNRIEAIIDYAAARGHRPKGPNPAAWSGNLEHVLASPVKAARKQHHAAVPYDEIPALLAQLATREGVGVKALTFLILTSARAGEVLGATWDEIDLENAMWIVPPGRMKARREHRVPLAPQAIALLKDLYREDGNPHLFIGARRQTLGDMAMYATLHRLGRTETVHGFRSAFSDWAHERTSHSNHVIEISLAHAVGNEVEKAYRRTDLFEKRRKLMESWATFVTTAPVEQRKGDVVPMRGR